MANVLFKRGLQANLPAQYNDGVFYFTTDTSRLYIDTGTKRHLLNQTIQVKSSVTELSAMSDAWSAGQKADHAGDFYYVDSGADSVSGNILAYWNGTEWIQINPDTDTFINSSTLNTIVSNNTATVTQALTGLGKQPRIESNLSITGANGIIVGSSTNNNVTISGSTYAVSTTLTGANNEIATIALDSSNTNLNSSYARFYAGDSIEFSTTSNGIVISALDTLVQSATLASPAEGQLSITLNQNGQSPVTSTLSNLKVMLSDNYYLPLTSNTTGTAAQVYTKQEIDGILNGLDGMHVVGTIGESGVGTITTLPTSNVHQGDVYIVVTEQHDVSAGGARFDSNLNAPDFSNVRIGDMIIAQGTETDGVISSANLTWLYVPAGNDAADGFIYRGAATPADNLLVLKDGNNVAAAGVQLVAGTDMAVSSTSTTAYYGGRAGAGDQLTTTINHATITTTTSSTAIDATGDFVALQNITVNNGHITGISYGTYTPIGYSLVAAPTISTTTVSAVNSANVDIKLNGTNGSSSTATVPIESRTINFTTSENKLQMELVWGEF